MYVYVYLYLLPVPMHMFVGMYYLLKYMYIQSYTVCNTEEDIVIPTSLTALVLCVFYKHIKYYQDYLTSLNADTDYIYQPCNCSLQYYKLQSILS